MTKNEEQNKKEIIDKKIKEQKVVVDETTKKIRVFD